MQPGYSKLVWILLLNFVAFSSPAQAPGKIGTISTSGSNEILQSGYVFTTNDHANIRSSAERVIKRFMDLLNVISTGLDLELPEIEKVIHESYSHPDSKIFYDSVIFIEDDIRLAETNTRPGEKTIDRYLNDFNLLYKKSKDQSVVFTNFQVSNVKASRYLYVMVAYDCLFKNKSILSDTSYVLKKKVAELKVEKVNKKWKTWITDVHALDSMDDIISTRNDVTITKVSAADSGSMEGSNESSTVHQKSVEQHTNGTGNPKQGNAKSTPEELHNYYIKEALYAENLRNYTEELKNYKLALSNKPNEAIKLNLKIQDITTKIKNLEDLDEKYMAGKYQVAITGYNKALKKDPDCSDYYLGRGKCYERDGDFRQAMKDYNKAIEADPYNSQVLKVRGSLHEVQGEYPEAIADYTKFAGMDKTNGYIFHKIAFLYLTTGNLNAAIEALDQAILIDNHVASFFNLKGELLYKLKKPVDALANFNKSLSLDSSKAASYFFRGLSENDLKMIDLAGEDFLKARKLGLNDAQLKQIQQIGLEIYKVSMSRYEAGHFDSAITKLKTAILMDPDKDQYRFNMGECYFKLNDFVNAIKSYSEAIDLNSNNKDAYVQRGLAKFNMTKYDEATRDYTAAMKLSPKHLQTYKYLGDVYLKKHDYTNAIATYQAALSLSKSDRIPVDEIFLAELYNKSGESYFYSGNPFKAIQNFNEAVKNNNKDGAIYFNRGRTFLDFNELDHSEEDLKKALSYEDKNPLWNFKLGELYQKKGKYDLAISQYSKSLIQDTQHLLSFDPVYNRAVCLVNLKRYADAFNNYEVININDVKYNYKNFNAEFGSVLFKLNKTDSALIYLNKAFLSDSLSISVGYQLAQAYAVKKKTEDALLWLEKVLKLSSGQIKSATINQDFAVLRDDTRFITLMKSFY